MGIRADLLVYLRFDDSPCLELKIYCIIGPMDERRALRRRLFNLAAEQAGYFSAAQARDLGYSYQAQAHHVGAGNWQRVGRGLFRLAEWVPEPHDDLARWTLWSKGRGVVSHETAMGVHDIGEFESPRIHLTVPPEFTMRAEALVLHFAELPDSDVMQRTGFRVTTPTRTIVDVAATSPDEQQLGRAITEAEQRGLLTLRALRSRADAVDARGALNIERALSAMTAAS
jgi:predicted transcriptional regulator of viral defense system